MSGLTPVTRPSETSAGRSFVDHFEEKDQSTARLLIDSLEIHNFSHILNALREEVSQAVGTRDGSPAILIPIRSQEDLLELPGGADHIAYRTFQPGAGFSPMPGSEGEIGSIISSLTMEEPERFFPPTLSLDEIRAQKIRTIILLTDYCGSGNQALRFARSFIRNPRVASWLSSGHLKLRVQSYASSSGAVDLFSREKGVTFSTLVAAKSGPATNWSSTQSEDVRSLCLTHAVSEIPESPLGYKDSFGLYLSSYRVPNNLPQILIRSGGPWPGLFPARRVPASFGSELTSYVPRSSVAQVLSNLGETELARFVEKAGRPLRVGQGLAAISLLEKGRSEREVMNLIGVGEEAWQQLRSTLIALNLVDYGLQLTDSGQAELKRSRLWLVRGSGEKNAGSRAPVEYLPTRLR